MGLVIVDSHGFCQDILIQSEFKSLNTNQKFICWRVDNTPLYRRISRDIRLFSDIGSGIALRDYQVDVASAVVNSVRQQAGRSIVVIFPRQSGKNELQAQIECYLLFLLSLLDTEMVKASPTWKPQSLNAMRRLERVLSRNLITHRLWNKESGYIYRIGTARIYFLSGADTANVVGATANTLLQCDEAQDVSINKWDKDFSPMAASTNATRVFWGRLGLRGHSWPESERLRSSSKLKMGFKEYGYLMLMTWRLRFRLMASTWPNKYTGLVGIIPWLKHNTFLRR